MATPPVVQAFAAAAAAMIVIPVAHGDIVWSDDFTGQTGGEFPTRDFTTNGSNDYLATSNSGFLL